MSAEIRDRLIIPRRTDHQAGGVAAEGGRQPVGGTVVTYSHSTVRAGGREVRTVLWDERVGCGLEPETCPVRDVETRCKAQGVKDHPGDIWCGKRMPMPEDGDRNFVTCHTN